MGSTRIINCLKKISANVFRFLSFISASSIFHCVGRKTFNCHESFNSFNSSASSPICYLQPIHFQLIYFQLFYFILLNLYYISLCLFQLDFQVSPTLLASLDALDDGDYDQKTKTKRGVLPKQATRVLKTWLFQHLLVTSLCNYTVIIK